MLVLDTTQIAVGERAEAFQTSVSSNCTQSMASFEDDGALQAEMHVYDLGTAKVFNIEATGTTLRRTPKMARAMNDCPIALALPVRTNNHLSRQRDDQLFGATDLMLVDLSAPYVYGWSGPGASYAFHVDFEQLELPMDTINQAARELRTSPLYLLVRDHISYVMTDTQRIVDSGAETQVAAASVELMRALIVSAAGDTQGTEEALRTSAASRVQAYVRNHLRDPGLVPARIAQANGMSIRALYGLYDELGLSLEQSIIEERLRGARDDLTSPRHTRRTVAAVARGWGFDNPSYFARRFRQTFGVTPRQARTEFRYETDARAI